MAIIFNLLPDGSEPLTLTPGVPAGYKGPLLTGATCNYAKNKFSELMLQELHGEEYRVRFIIGKFLKRVYFTGWLHAEGLYSYLMFKDGARKKLLHLGTTHIREGQYSCFYTKPSDCSTHFDDGRELRMLDLFYSPLLLEELVPIFPELKSVIGKDTGAFITQKPRRQPVAIKEIFNQLLYCPFDETTRQFYFDLKVRELIYQILENVFKEDAAKLSFTPWEIKRIHEVPEILQEYITTKPPSIRKLSKLVALNEYKLKRGFRQYFNSTIGKWIQEEKLQHSRVLLLDTNKPIKEISRLVGYPLTTNFITAFRRRFGITPGDLRRK